MTLEQHITRYIQEIKMSNVIVLGYEDFKRLITEHRLYYYRGDDYYDFNFLADGMIIKTSILKSEIENEKRFFSDKIFYGATELVFRIPNPKEDMELIDGIRTQLNPLIEIVEVQEEEIKDTDIQREGVGEE